MDTFRPFAAVLALSLACAAGVLLYWQWVKDWGDASAAPAAAPVPVAVAAREPSAVHGVAPPAYRIVERREKGAAGGPLLELRVLAQEPLTRGNLRSLLDVVAAEAARGAYGPKPGQLRLLVFSSRTGVDAQGLNWVAFYWSSGASAEPALVSIRTNSLAPPGPHVP